MRLRPGHYLAPRWRSLQRSPGPLAGFGEGNREGRMETVRERKERKRKERRGEEGRKGEGTQIWGGGSLALGG